MIVRANRNSWLFESKYVVNRSTILQSKTLHLQTYRSHNWENLHQLRKGGVLKSFFQQQKLHAHYADCNFYTIHDWTKHLFCLLISKVRVPVLEKEVDAQNEDEDHFRI